ncbi:MAG TPA: type II toxin-antitoxin system HicA family toxin [Segetibacter sp.]
MSKFDKLLQKILSGTSDKNIHFYDLIKVLNSLEFSERIKGSHHIFSKPEIEEIINIQPLGTLAKPYQVKQVREIIIKYKLLENHDPEV